MVWPREINEPLATLRATIDDVERVYNAEPGWTPCSLEHNELLTHRFDAPDDHAFIYVFEVTGGDTALILQRIREAKANHKLPHIPNDAQPGRILYVGSSGNDIQGRLRQHIRPTPVGTYALKLSTWMGRVPEFSARIHLRGYAGVSRAAREIMEDSIAAQLTPMVGKRGGNAF